MLCKIINDYTLGVILVGNILMLGTQIKNIFTTIAVIVGVQVV